jgi:hypothetical protein
VLSKTVSGNTLGNGQWASSGVQQAGRGGLEFMAGILPIRRGKVEIGGAAFASRLAPTFGTHSHVGASLLAKAALQSI